MNRTAVPALVVVVGMGLAACAPGSSSSGGSSASATDRSVKTDAAQLGDVTLTLWDQEVRGGGNAQLTKNIASFQEKYPNIKIKRVSRSFDDLVKTLRLALTGNDAPDIVQANNTRSQMGQFVKAGQLVPLDPWMKSYGWDKRYSQSLRSVVSYSPDGKTFGSGNLYGLPQVGEVVGVYVNKDKLAKAGLQPPTDWASFESSLAALKAKGEVPLMLGNLDKWPAVHVFGVLQGQYAKPDEIRKLGFGNPGASYTSEGNKQAAGKLVEWVDKGYFNQGFNGQGYDPAWQAFTKGQGTYLIAGTWLQADISKAMGDKVSFMLPPPAKAGDKTYTTGASGQPFAITSKAKNPDAAAAFINFITSPDAMKVIAETENLPVVDTAQQKAPNPLGQQVFTAFATTTSSDGLLPYLDWATPTMSDTIGAALQDLLAKKATPEQTLDKLQKDYGDFTGGKG
ncbi:extracellular solute-binding protein [Arsenicicoccus sp. oral taxon 190]|uniref:extracellular solute-binding protein n=1 Tax=Arsenicicoccus sp. oral taxon 190 TaxID=1658671 RepID=UPI00067A1210|nr:extracellular solute-binding protein [Arsenicicoccus sp. oral taxon 190]AKT50895.1 sugar ABC transporter substrate-binding protein [Arsenicicoccus sp. oral taxon 190]